MKSHPTLQAEPKHKLIDATHADINMGNFLKKLIICEIAVLQTWEISPELKHIFEHQRSDHLHAEIGIVPSLMSDHISLLEDDELSTITRWQIAVKLFVPLLG